MCILTTEIKSRSKIGDVFHALMYDQSIAAILLPMFSFA